MLEITCQGAEVSVVSVKDPNVRLIRAVDAVAGIIINIPVTAITLAAIADAAIQQAA